MLENLQIAKKVLNGQSGIYAFVHIPTGTSYIGSSIDLGGRIMDHINNSTNPHLKSALLKYGLSHYAFVILEYCLSSDLLKREQHFLGLLDTLPKELCYNFLRTAGSSLGYKHTEDARAKISKAQTGTLNSMFGKISGNAMSINVYSLDNKLVRSF